MTLQIKLAKVYDNNITKNKILRILATFCIFVAD